MSCELRLKVFDLIAQGSTLCKKDITIEAL